MPNPISFPPNKLQHNAYWETRRTKSWRKVSYFPCQILLKEKLINH